MVQAVQLLQYDKSFIVGHREFLGIFKPLIIMNTGCLHGKSLEQEGEKEREWVYVKIAVFTGKTQNMSYQLM